jgi:hypothetical protein
MLTIEAGTPPNEIAAWALILLGMLTGAAIGVRFQDERFLGGYTSRPRRLLRLGHISFFGLGILNLLFAHSVPSAAPGVAPQTLALAGWCMIAGAVLMPLCCLLNTRSSRLNMLFAAPVASLTTGVVILLTGMVRA